MGVSRLQDFEDPNQKNCFIVLPRSKGTITLSMHFRCEKWERRLTVGVVPIDIQSWKTIICSGPIQKRELWRGGMKMWIVYRTGAMNGKNMEVRLWDNTKNVRVRTFKVDMGFKGWRGVSVSYGECRENSNSLKAQVTTTDFVLDHQDVFFVDLLEFVPTLAFQSRNKIVPPFSKFRSN